MYLWQEYEVRPNHDAGLYGLDLSRTCPGSPKESCTAAILASGQKLADYISATAIVVLE